MERHNFEVTHVGFGSYMEATRPGRFKGKRSRGRSAERFQHKQQVYVFFSFFNAGYKPNARSHNVVQEDIDHFLKYGTFLHGEWFEGGMRCPGGPTGEARLPLPEALSEAPLAPAVLPGMDRELEVTDGCGAQYDGGSQHHQTAECSGAPRQQTGPRRGTLRQERRQMLQRRHQRRRERRRRRVTRQQSTASCVCM